MTRIPPRLNKLGMNLQQVEAEIGEKADGWHSMGRYYYGWAIREAYLRGAQFVAENPDIVEDAKFGGIYQDPEKVKAAMMRADAERRAHSEVFERGVRDFEMAYRARMTGSTKQFDHAQRGWPAVTRVHLIDPAKWRLTRWSKFKMWVSSLAYKLSVWWERVKNTKLIYDAEHDTWLGESKEDHVACDTGDETPRPERSPSTGAMICPFMHLSCNSLEECQRAGCRYVITSVE